MRHGRVCRNIQSIRFALNRFEDGRDVVRLSDWWWAQASSAY